MLEKTFMNLREADFSDRAQRGPAIKENADELDFIKIVKCLLSKRIPFKNKLARHRLGINICNPYI